MKGPNLAEWLIIAAMAAAIALAFASVSTHAIRGARLQEFGSLMAQLTNGLPNISDLQIDAKEPFAVEPFVERASHEEPHDIGDRTTPNVYSAVDAIGSLETENYDYVVFFCFIGGTVHKTPNDFDGWDEIEYTFDP